jgi:succinoglycan biosynthesis protein ExoM
VRVSILIITYRRPRELRRLLESLEGLDLGSGCDPEIEVVVVDNDAEGSGIRTLEDLSSDGYRWSLRTVVEPQPGISQARNRALVEADRPEFVAFVDDDEHVSEQWLRELLAVQKATGADAVGGPVLPELPDGAPEWIRSGGFFERRRYPDRSEVPLVATNNVLLRVQALGDLDAPTFDPAFSATGGGDTHLALRLKRAGARLVWADRAVVWEVVPPSRAHAAWLLRRWFRLGCSLALAERAVDGFSRVALARSAKGGVRMLLGVVLGVPSIFLGQLMWFRTLRMITFGAGMIAGVVGITFHEYARDNRSSSPEGDYRTRESRPE